MHEIYFDDIFQVLSAYLKLLKGERKDVLVLDPTIFYSWENRTDTLRKVNLIELLMVSN